MESSTVSGIWRGDADFYRRRLASNFTYDVILEMTAHSYVLALEGNPLFDMRGHASYLSTVFSDVSIEQARSDMSRVIGEWYREGYVILPDDVLLLAEAGHLDLPFAIASNAAMPSFAA